MTPPIRGRWLNSSHRRMAQVDYNRLIALLEDAIALGIDMDQALGQVGADIRAGEIVVSPTGAAHLRQVKRALEKQLALLRDERQHAKRRHG